jgi:hypothetical protein
MYQDGTLKNLKIPTMLNRIRLTNLAGKRIEWLQAILMSRFKEIRNMEKSSLMAMKIHLQKEKTLDVSYKMSLVYFGHILAR